MPRQFSPEYKKRILEELDAAPRGEKGSILRRENLYSSTVTKWRKRRAAGTLDSLTSSKCGPRGKCQHAKELARLRAENARLEEKVGTLEDLMEAQGKVSALLQEMSRKSAEPDTNKP